jgi:SchA/CurD like domain
VERHALTFAVKPRTGREVRRILSDYPRPETEIDGGARLLGTTVFFWHDQVVRVMDVDGPLPVVMQHLAAQPAIRATEEALNPLLAEPRDLNDPAAARAFFMRAMMTRVIHRVTAPHLLAQPRDGRQRIALRYPVRPGNGEKLTSVVTAGRPLVAGDQTVLASTTVFRHGDLVVRFAEFVGELEEAGAHLGRTVVGAPTTPQLNELLEPGWDLGTTNGFRRFFHEQQLTLVTDRRADELTGS